MVLTALQSFAVDLLVDVLRIVIVLVVGKVLLHAIIAGVVASISVARGSQGFEERTHAIKGVMRVVGNTIIYGIVLFLVLADFGIDIRPILAGAGALGLIAGLGAQTLVKDFVSGLVISAEDQYRVGDRVKINSAVEGTVVQIAMRLTTLRGEEGETHHILNSSITTVTNLSRR